jgi:hypothetical protein
VPLVPPPAWSDAELLAARDSSEARARALRQEAGPRAFGDTYRHLEPRVRRGFRLSNNLRQISGDVFRVDPDIWQMFRYVCAPPVSQEDFWTLVGGPKFRRVPADFADDAALAIVDVVDPVRFPWVGDERDPTPHELDAAVLATTCLWAAQDLGTQRRSESSKRQEAAVGAALRGAGLTLDESRTPVRFADGMTRGTYSSERLLAGAKCDVPARLHDGRLLAIECKVSNGPKNGWKRVNREVGGKAQTWRAEFGNQVLTAAVLDGVFDLASLKTARDGGVLVFWEHDLDPLVAFVRAAV